MYENEILVINYVKPIQRDLRYWLFVLLFYSATRIVIKIIETDRTSVVTSGRAVCHYDKYTDRHMHIHYL
jgi:hypothetical protein